MAPDEEQPNAIGRVAALEDALAERDAKLAERDAKLGELEALVAKQAAQIEILLETLSQNSGNSHHPPSSDGPGSASRQGAPKKSKSKRKRGGQKGRRGARRQLLDDGEVDEFIELFPAACCGCGHALPETPDTDARRYQCIDLVRGGRHLTQWRRHEVACRRCGARTRAPYDAAVIPSSPFGPRLTAVVAMLTGVYHLSRRRTSQLLHELFDVAISVGTVSNIEAAASTALATAADEALREVEAAAVKHTDATTWLLAGLTKSLWTFASKAATAYKIFDDGRTDTIRPMFGGLTGVLISDRASVFGFWDMAWRQICWAHLLRKFIAFSQRAGPAGSFGDEMVDCTRLIFSYWHSFRKGQLSREELDTWMRPVRMHFDGLLRRAVAANIPRLSGSCADIVAHRDALWTFVAHDGVEPTNNHAERELRAFVLWRKRSFGCQSERGLRFAERVMTVVHTARKQGKDVLDFLVRSITAYRGRTTPPALIGSVAPA